MKKMYYGIPNSPVTILSDSINDTQTVIPVEQTAKLPPAPNIATIGFGTVRETVIYNTKTDTTLEGVTRGIEGTRKEWAKGTEIARYYTSYEHNNMIDNIIILNNTLQDIISQLNNLIDIGINQNGEYMKFSNGRMVCWIDNFRLSTLGVSDYYITDVWTFPHKFIEPPAVFPVGEGLYTTAEFASLIVGYASTTETTTRINAWKRDSGKIAEKDRTKGVNIMAIGRWK